MLPQRGFLQERTFYSSASVLLLFQLQQTTFLQNHLASHTTGNIQQIYINSAKTDDQCTMFFSSFIFNHGSTQTMSNSLENRTVLNSHLINMIDTLGDQLINIHTQLLVLFYSCSCPDSGFWFSFCRTDLKTFRVLSDAVRQRDR